MCERTCAARQREAGWRKKAIWVWGEKKIWAYFIHAYVQPRTPRFILGRPASCLQHVFLFGRPLCYPTLAWCGPLEPPQWRLCAPSEWQTCPYKLHGTPLPPLPQLPAHQIHIKKSNGLHHRFHFLESLLCVLLIRKTWRRVSAVRPQVNSAGLSLEATWQLW